VIQGQVVVVIRVEYGHVIQVVDFTTLDGSITLETAAALTVEDSDIDMSASMV